jgi:type IV secretory pathway VirB10-like protein
MWDKFRDAMVSAVANCIVGGVVLLVGFSITYAFIGRSELSKISEALNSKITNANNDAVQREADMVKKIASLEDEIEKLKRAPAFPVLPDHNPTNPHVAPGNPVPPAPTVSPEQQGFDYLKRNIQKHLPITK